MNTPLSCLTPCPPPESTDAATSRGPISQIPTKGKPTPTGSPGTPLYFGKPNSQIHETSADLSVVRNWPRQAPLCESDGGGKAYINDVGTIPDVSFYQPGVTGVLDPTTVPGSTREGGSVRDEEEYDDGEGDRTHYPQEEISTRTRGLADIAVARNDSSERQIIRKLHAKPRSADIQQDQPPLPPSCIRLWSGDVKILNALPFSAGPFADVWDGSLANDRVVVKSYRIYSTVDPTQARMVRFP